MDSADFDALEDKARAALSPGAYAFAVAGADDEITLADNIAAYTARHIQVVGVLAQKRDAVRRYVEETGLPFDILVDERRDTLRAYGVWQRIGLDGVNIARPAYFLVETDGRISYSFIASNQFDYPDQKTLLAAIDAGGGE